MAQTLDGWTLINSYFRDRNIAQMEIDSYNQFVEKKLPEIIAENEQVVPKIEEVKVEFEKIEVLKPRIVEADGSPRTEFYPLEARIRNRTYSSPIYLTMKLLRRDVEQDRKKTYIGELPVMLKSNLCWLNGKTEEELIQFGEDPKDFGGYFIINGSEKALMTQEVLASDRVIVSEQTDKIVAEVISTRGAFKGRVRIIRNPDGVLNVTFPASPRKLKLFVLLKALGLKTSQSIREAFIDEVHLQNDVMINIENLLVKSEKEALDKIGKFVAPGQVEDYRLRRAQEVIDAFLLPHIGQDAKHRLAKAYYLVMMATKAIERAYRLREEDDKDHYSNKRLELSGKLMEHLFRYSFKYFIKDLKFQIDRTVTRRRKLNISTIVRPGAVSERVRFAMSTGNWIGRATGVSKFMDRVNYLSPLTDLRKVKSPLDKNRELYEARDVHGTHWGRLCPIETPDGPQCLAPETEIILSDYSSMSIAEFENFWKKERIASIDWNSQAKAEKKANAARFLKMRPAKKVLELKTKETGRSIKATLAHPFYSEEVGKTELQNLKLGDRIAVMPLKPVKFEKPEGKTILTEGDIAKALPAKSDLKYIVSELKNKNLLPLRDSDKRLGILARLLGHCFGDGSLTLSMKKFKSSCAIVFSGRQEDLEEIGKELQELGFPHSKITCWSKKSVLENGMVINGISTRMECYSKPLWVLLKALGAPAGDKALAKFGVPEWLKTQRKTTIRDFLAAYFGSEMTKPAVDKRDGKTFLQPGFSLNKSKELVENGVRFAEELKELLSIFGIKIAQVKVVDGVKRKSGIETRKIKVLLNSSIENLAELYGTIGFAYCSERKSIARLAFAYLESKKFEIEKRQRIAEKIAVLAGNGKQKSEILKEIRFEARGHDVANWLKAFRKGKTVRARASEIDFPKFKEWIRECAVSENGMVWETIESLREVEEKEVIDITTLQEYHNFIANNFLVGNCGLVKNLAMLAEVTTESEEEPVEKLVRDMGVKLK